MAASSNPLNERIAASAVDRDEITVGYDVVLTRLIADYPGISVGRVESTLLREWEVFTSGRPTVIPVGVEAGAREMLERFR